MTFWKGYICGLIVGAVSTGITAILLFLKFG